VWQENDCIEGLVVITMTCGNSFLELVVLWEPILPSRDLKDEFGGTATTMLIFNGRSASASPPIVNPHYPP